MMRARIHAEHLAVEHVRNGRKRMPVLGMHMGEGPPNPSRGQPRPHMRVLEHVKRIVIINELVPAGLGEHGPRKPDQKNTDAD